MCLGNTWYRQPYHIVVFGFLQSGKDISFVDFCSLLPPFPPSFQIKFCVSYPKPERTLYRFLSLELKSGHMSCAVDRCCELDISGI